MNRTNQIINILIHLKLPIDIINIILQSEQKNILNESRIYWNHISKVGRSQNYNRFYYKENRRLLIDDIHFIQCDFASLTKIEQFRMNVKRKNTEYANFLNSVRYI